MSRNSIHVTMTAQLRRAQVRQRLDVLAERTGLPMAQIAGRAMTIGLVHLEGNLQLLFPNPTERMPEPSTASAPAVTEHTPTAPMPKPSTASTPAVTEHTPTAPMPEPSTASAPAVTEHTPTAPMPKPSTASTPAVTEHTPTAPMPEPSTASAPAVTEHTPTAPMPKSSTTSTPAVTEHTPTAPMPKPPTSLVESSLSAELSGRVTTQDAARSLNLTLPAFYSQLHRQPALKRHSKRVGRAAMWDLAGLRAEWTK